MYEHLPLIPPETVQEATGVSYYLVTPQGLAFGLDLEDSPLRTGQHQPNVHRAAFSQYQARTDDGLPMPAELAVQCTLRAASPELLQTHLSELRHIAGQATWLVHEVEGGVKLIPPGGVDAASGSRQVKVALHLVAADLRRYAPDGSVMP